MIAVFKKPVFTSAGEFCGHRKGDVLLFACSDFRFRQALQEFAELNVYDQASGN
ncbi:MAG: hypothetical protein KGJ93_01115 [Patescibacteria group bacterium]|nr:hypothetical protein [Patescibacteria group bacterium]